MQQAKLTDISAALRRLMSQSLWKSPVPAALAIRMNAVSEYFKVEFWTETRRARRDHREVCW